jgi:hypothetical protein
MAAPLRQILTGQVRPWLALALTAALITTAPAQVVPPHLVSMSAELLRATKDQLQTPPRDVGPPQVMKRTNDLLEQEMLYCWGRGRVAQAGVVPKIASTLGVPRVTPENLPTLQKFLDNWSQGETDQALREFYQATGRRPPSATEREALSQKLSEVLRADPAASARRHTIQGRNRGQSVTLEWQPEKFRFSMRVEDDGSGGTEPFRTTIAGDVKPKISQDGKDLELSVKPAVHPLHAQDAEELRQICNLLFGQWQDGEGGLWQINPADRRGPKEPAQVPRARPSIADQIKETEARLEKIKKSQIYVWKNPKTGERVEQTRFQQLPAPFDFVGQTYSIPKAEEEIRRLEKELAGLRAAPAEGSAIPSPPLPEQKAGGLVTAINLSKTRQDGSIQDWPEASCQGGRLQARGIFNDIRDMKPDLPEPVKKNLLSWSAPRWLDLSLRFNPATREAYLEGDSWAEHVTYSADDYRIKRIHTPYAKPLLLSRVTEKGDFRIVRIEVDSWKWRDRILNLKYEVSKIEADLKWHKSKQDEAKSKSQQVDQQRQQVEQDMEGAAKAVADQEASLKGPPPLPDKPSPDLQRRLKTKADLERIISEIDNEIIALGENKPPGWAEILSARDRVQQGYKEQLQRINSKIQEEYDQIKFDPKKKLEEMQKQLKPLQDQYWSLRKEKAHLIGEMSSASHTIEYHQEHINQLEKKLTDLNQKLTGLDENDTPFIKRVLVHDSKGEEIGCWEAWAPFEALQRINEEANQLETLLKDLKSQKDESQARFQEAAAEASKALDEVAHAIWGSFGRQAFIESGYYAYDVFGKGWRKGGPLGALMEAVGKGAEAILLGGGTIKIKEADPREIEKRMEEEYGLKPDTFADTLNEFDLSLIVAKRVAKDSVSREWKMQENKYIMAPATKIFLVDRQTEKLIKMEKDLTAPLDQFMKQAKQLKKYNQNLKHLKEGEPYKLRNFAIGFFKDVSKDLLKDMAKLVEENAWEEFFEKDIWARLCFAGYQETNKLYWDTFDQYMAWQALRDMLVKGYDPKSGFMARKTALLKEGENYAIQLELKNPQGKKEKVWIGIRETRLAGDHKFSIQAKDLKPSNEKGDVVLKTEFQ